MFGLPALIRTRIDRELTDEEIAAMAKESSDGDDESPLPNGLLRRLADAAVNAYRSHETQVLHLDPEEAAPIRTQILTVVAFMEAYLLKVTGVACKVKIAANARTHVTVCARALEAGA